MAQVLDALTLKDTSTGKTTEYQIQDKVARAQIAAQVAASTDENADYAAEVVDARIGADGESYDSLGEAVRGQREKSEEKIEQVKSNLVSFEKELECTKIMKYPINRFNKSDVETNKTFNSSGDLIDSSDFSASGYISSDNLTSFFVCNSVPTNIATYYVLYDKNKNKISNRLVTSKTEANDCSSASYLRVIFSSKYIDSFELYSASEVIKEYTEYFEPYYVVSSKRIERLEKPKKEVVTVGESGDFTSLLQALKETSSNVKIHILEGNFDIEKEYMEYYGDDFWETYDGYQKHTDDNFYKGLWLDNGRVVEGEAGTIITFKYNGENSNVSSYFSVFANGKNTTLKNLTISVNRNVRYSIHDDFKPSDGIVRWENIIFKGSPHSSAHIGAGLGYGSTYILDGLVFLENLSEYDISYHGCATSNPNKYFNKIIVKNCYGTKKCSFRWYGINTGICPCIVNNCTFDKIECVAYDENQKIENMKLYSYNNVENT